ncbi:ATP-binding protein [Virgisporangium aurantiacum]|uniref:ATP-binding protein n=1 Tax=Virgisporangium aurantiacum TaxID=175570 RepID=UPI0019501572|nr:ATP-binding protein [Virgisporangium aurantiacum]
MPAHLGDLLETARRQHFVGRRREVASFDDAIAGRSPRRVLFLHGQGGIGKTTLLLELRARAAGRRVVLIDGRDVDPSPEGLRAALRPTSWPLTGGVLLIDGYEQLVAIDAWVRDDLVLGLSADAVVVLAGRDPPAAPWRTDPGWRHLVAVHRLDPFDAAESGELLAHAGVAPSDRSHLITLGRGHPLTVALLADLTASGEVPATLADAPDLVSALLESFLRDVPSELHRIGLAACAIAWLTTEELLARLVGADAAPAVWQWLARRPFITAGPRGLSAHDLARDVLDAEFERREPERYRSYRRIIHAHAVAALRATTGLDRQRHAQQMFFLLGNSPLAEVVARLRARGSATVAPARPDEHEPVCAVIERFEGPANAELARAWIGEQPEQLSVVRAGDNLTGFAYHVLCPGRSELEDRDPVVRAVLDHIAREGPLRPGELVGITRYAAGTRAHQHDPYALLAASVCTLIEMLARPLAWSVFVGIDPLTFAFSEYMAFTRLVGIDHGGVRHVAYGIDWRRISVDVYLDLVRDRAHSGETGPPPAALLRRPPMDRTRFAAAVKAALQTVCRPDRLATNPLIDSALAATPAGPSVDRLRTTIGDAVTDLGNRPRGDQLRAVLDRTYLRPAPSQEAAAQILDLPLSTYRRHLARALDELTDILWMTEIEPHRRDASPLDGH